MSDEASVVARVNGRVGHILLNRPRALNALDLGMIEAMHAALDAWRDDAAVELVVVSGAGERGFCAGGDIRAIRDAGLVNDQGFISEFFGREYALNLKIAEYPKPYVALIDGICMGGGIGISVHGTVRVASQKAMFAMPETGIALFPDVGGSYFLPRMAGYLGFYLGLSGARVVGADGVWAGFATHFVKSEDFAGLFEALCGEGVGAVERFSVAELPAYSLNPDLAAIERCFSAETLEGVLELLADEGEFGARTLAVLAKMSPSSLLWTFDLLRAGIGQGLGECLARELRLTAKVVPHHEFLEGVRAMIIDKDRAPKWVPASLAEVDHGLVAAMLG